MRPLPVRARRARETHEQLRTIVSVAGGLLAIAGPAILAWESYERTRHGQGQEQSGEEAQAEEGQARPRSYRELELERRDEARRRALRPHRRLAGTFRVLVVQAWKVTLGASLITLFALWAATLPLLDLELSLVGLAVLAVLLAHEVYHRKAMGGS